jgi:hypothetical protein
MNLKVRQFVSVLALALALSLMATTALAQGNSNTSTGEMKKSGSEAKQAGTSLGHNVKHGRLVRGGKHFGKHAGRSGKHFGRSTKKAIKKVLS